MTGGATTVFTAFVKMSGDKCFTFRKGANKGFIKFVS